MYEAFFQLSKRPFSATADTSCFFAPEPVEEALDELILRVESGQGIGILTAAPGIGKTLLCRRLIAELRDKLLPAFLATTNFPTRRALLQAVLFELGQPYSGLDEQELRLELLSAVRSLALDGRSALVVIDEAHLLSDRLLEEVRLLANLSDGTNPLIQVVLSGQLSLEERLTSPALEALNQRVACHVYLEPFTRQQSIDYVAFRLNWAGGNCSRIFAPDALDLVAHACNGIPRCINQLCDHSLLLAYVAEAQPVGVSFVEDALADLKQLPLHWNNPLPAAPPPYEHGQPVDNDPAARTQFADGEHTDEGGEADFSIEVGADPGPGDSAQTEDSGNSSGTVANDQDTIWNSPRERETVVPSEQSGIQSSVYETTPSFSLEERLRRGVVPLEDYRASGTLFEEEVVIDRYAALDAGRPAIPFAQPDDDAAAHAAGSSCRADIKLSCQADDDDDDDSMPPANTHSHAAAFDTRQLSPDLLIDEIIPLLKDACGDVEPSAAGSDARSQSSAPLMYHPATAHDSADDQPSVCIHTGIDEDSRLVADPSRGGEIGQDSIRAAGELAEHLLDSDLEQQIASDVLDVCLEVEEAIVGGIRGDEPASGGASERTFTDSAKQPADDSSDASLNHFDLPISETPASSQEPAYDVIEPEDDRALPNLGGRGGNPRFNVPPTESALTQKPNYKRIFSMLRRKQRHS